LIAGNAAGFTVSTRSRGFFDGGIRFGIGIRLNITDRNVAFHLVGCRLGDLILFGRTIQCYSSDYSEHNYYSHKAAGNQVLLLFRFLSGVYDRLAWILRWRGWHRCADRETGGSGDRRSDRGCDRNGAWYARLARCHR